MGFPQNGSLFVGVGPCTHSYGHLSIGILPWGVSEPPSTDAFPCTLGDSTRNMPQLPSIARLYSTTLTRLATIFPAEAACITREEARRLPPDGRPLYLIRYGRGMILLRYLGLLSSSLTSSTSMCLCSGRNDKGVQRFDHNWLGASQLHKI